MKKDIHPESHPVIFVDTSCGAEFLTASTMKSKETREIDGITYSVCNVEISSASHPFFTGKKILVDTARRVEKFEERLKKAQSVSKTVKSKKEKQQIRKQKKEKK